jgi:autotransporter translocation and assembly factor TamB
MMRNKRGFEMIWSTWVIMILAAMLLIFILLFFAKGSGNFLDNIKNYFSKSNVDSVIKGCNILVDSGNKYNFCCEQKNVKYLDGKNVKSGDFSCFELMNKSFVNNGIKSGIDCINFEC